MSVRSGAVTDILERRASVVKVSDRKSRQHLTTFGAFYFGGLTIMFALYSDYIHVPWYVL